MGRLVEVSGQVVQPVAVRLVLAALAGRVFADPVVPGRVAESGARIVVLPSAEGRYAQSNSLLSAYSLEAAERRLARDLDGFLRDPQIQPLAPEDRLPALRQLIGDRELRVKWLRRHPGWLTL